MKKIFKFILKFVFGIVVISIIVGVAKCQNQKEEENLFRETIEEGKTATYIDCTASTLLSECNSNGMNAKASYLGKFLNITGYVDDIDGSGEFICISDRYDLRGIRCNLDGSFRNILKDLKSGERITVKCKCTDVDNVYAYVVTVVEIK